MPRDGWYNSNEYRDYPFITRVDPLANNPGLSAAPELVDLPRSALVDFGAIMGLDSGFLLDQHTVYLHSITRADGTFRFEFRTTSPDAANEALVFVRDETADEFATEWVEATATGSTPVSSSHADACESQPKWTGFLVTGTFDDLIDAIPDNTTVEYNAQLWVVEPARLQSLLRSFARSLNLANTDRTHAFLPTTCESRASDAVPPVFVNTRCMQGLLAFKEGFNATIRQDDATNSIVIGAAAGGGKGQPCEEVPLFIGEEAPTGSPFLSGGPGCKQVITTINGKGGRALQVYAGAGFTLQTAPEDPHTLVLTADFNRFAACLATPPESQSSIGPGG